MKRPPPPKWQKNRLSYFALLSGLCLTLVPASSLGAEDGSDLSGLPPEVQKLLEEAGNNYIEVIGEKPEDLLEVPGAATVVSDVQLRATQPVSGTEMMRVVPGLNVVDEEGLGLRANIGFRGLDPDRSQNVLVLEDGVPVSMAPYGAPSLYYSPPVDRMQRIEVVKGSGSVLFGPQTIGGVVNFVTPDPPEETEAQAVYRHGAYGYKQGHLSFGQTQGQVGYLLQLAYTGYEGPRALDLQRYDAVGKLRLQLNDTSWMALKLNVYDETSRSTYLGLTSPQFESDPTLSLAKNDRFEIRRYASTLTHHRVFGSGLLLRTTLYGHTVERNWRRQDYSRRYEEGQSYVAIYDGEGQGTYGEDGQTYISDEVASSGPTDGSAIFFLNSTGNRNRSYVVGGLEPRLTWQGSERSTLELGARVHSERAEIQRIQGTNASASSGDISNHEYRSGLALSGFAHEKFSLTDKIQLTGGLRYEHFADRRSVLRTEVDGLVQDLEEPTTNQEPSVSAALIPGAGFTVAGRDWWSLYGGVHRGFSPPRTQDAIDPGGFVLELDPEFSWNYELGARAVHGDALAEATLFMLDFSNQVIEPTESGGAVSEGGVVNGGESRHLGVEISAHADLLSSKESEIQLPFSAGYTFVDARFGEEGWTLAVAGNYLPYAPRHTAFAQFGLLLPMGFSAQVAAHHQSEMYADKENTELPSIDGRKGLIEGRTLLDVSASYEPTGSHYVLSLSVKNVSNEQYIASRRPAGIMPGAPRQWVLGLSGRL